MTILGIIKLPNLQNGFTKKRSLAKAAKVIFWFLLGAALGFFFFTSFLYIFYKNTYANHIYAGVLVNGIDFGGKNKEDVKNYFAKKNAIIQRTTFILEAPETTATISARQIDLGYDEDLLAQQAYSIGRSSDTLSDISLLLQAYMDSVRLPAAYQYSESKLDKLLSPLRDDIDIKPIEAVFTIENNRVTTFRLPKNGKAVDMPKLKKEILSQMDKVALSNSSQTIRIKVPTTTLKPSGGASVQAEKLGIRELVARGTSHFSHSIENRIFNLTLAASRLNGVLIPPGQVFSFTKTLGDVSSFTGYKQAYVIENGKTVLGDGGGVCQVSTTLFRAALNAGLPILERNPHAYRVGYYEQDSPPGIDAAIYSPTVDLKFKNDTKNHILIQSYANLSQSSLTFELYGTKDGREVIITKPVIVSESPAPEPLYQDDPNLPKGQIKQIDFAAAGAKVYFTRTVKKDGKIILNDTFNSNYRPWQAIFLRGTKE